MDHKQEVQRLRVLLMEAWSRPMSEKLDMGAIAVITQQLTNELRASGCRMRITTGGRGRQSINPIRVRELWQAGYTAADIGTILGKEDGRVAYKAASIQVVVNRLRQDKLVNYRRRMG